MSHIPSEEELRLMTVAEICDLVMDMAKIIREQQLVIEQLSN